MSGWPNLVQLELRRGLERLVRLAQRPLALGAGAAAPKRNRTHNAMPLDARRQSCRQISYRGRGQSTTKIAVNTNCP